MYESIVSIFKQLIFLNVGLCLLLLPGAFAAAQTEEDELDRLLDRECEPDITEGLAPAEEPPFFEFLDSPQRSISSGVESLAQGIDEFFAKEEVRYERSGTYVQLIGDLLFEESGEVHSSGNLRVKLRVPRTQKKLKLLLESDPDEQRSPLERVTDQIPQSKEDPSLFAGFQADIDKAEGWSYKPSVGLRLQFPIDYYVRLSASRIYQFEAWSLYLEEKPYWFDTTGFGFDSNMQWSYALREDLLFRSHSLLRYTDERDMFDFTQVLSLTQTLSTSRALTFEAAAFADSEPAVYATEYLLLARYRQRIHSDYMFLEIVPQVRFRKEFGFNDEHLLLLRVEFLFQR